MKLTKKDKDRFWALVVKKGKDECWPWVGSNSRQGYGHFDVRRAGQRKMFRAHRLAYILTYGALPQDRMVIPTCNFSLCCNPRHLHAGTNEDKVRFAALRGSYNTEARHLSRPRGEDHPRARLTWEKVRAIRTSRTSTTDLAKLYEVSEVTIRGIIRGTKWKEEYDPLLKEPTTT